MRVLQAILRKKSNFKGQGARGEGRGFTLVETILVATIFSFVAAGLIGCFVSGIKLWDRAKSSNLSDFDTLLFFEKISKELRQALAINTDSVGFEGAAEEISFPTLSSDNLLKVSYTFNPQEKTILRRQVNLKYVFSGEADKNYTETEIPNIADFSLSYLKFDGTKKEYSWQDNWQKGTGIFSAVKLKAKINGEDYTKTIFIPVSG